MRVPGKRYRTYTVFIFWGTWSVSALSHLGLGHFGRIHAENLRNTSETIEKKFLVCLIELVRVRNYYYVTVIQNEKRRPVSQLQFLAIKNISANKVYSFKRYLTLFMNAWLVLCNENTHFSYLQCTRLDKTSQSTATDSRSCQIYDWHMYHSRNKSSLIIRYIFGQSQSRLLRN